MSELLECALYSSGHRLTGAGVEAGRIVIFVRVLAAALGAPLARIEVLPALKPEFADFLRSWRDEGKAFTLTAGLTGNPHACTCPATSCTRVCYMRMFNMSSCITVWEFHNVHNGTCKLHSNRLSISDYTRNKRGCSTYVRKLRLKNKHGFLVKHWALPVLPIPHSLNKNLNSQILRDDTCEK